MIHRNIILAAAAIATLGAAPVAAATMQAVFTGTMSGGFDLAGEFGAPATSLAGKSVTLTFVYDTDLGNPFSIPGQIDKTSGGTRVPASNPTLSATLSIDGSPVTLTGQYYSSYAVCDMDYYYCSFDEFSANVQDYQAVGDDYANNSIQAGGIFFDDILPDELDEPFSVSLVGQDAFGSFQFLIFVDGSYTSLDNGSMA